MVAVNLVTFRGIAELVAAVMEGADKEEEEAGEDPDLDPDRDPQCADVDAPLLGQEVVQFQGIELLNGDALLQDQDLEADQFQGKGVLQGIAATSNADARRQDLKAALYQKEGLQVAQGPGQEVQSKNQGREVQPRVMDIEVTAVQVIKEDKSNNKK